MFKKYNVIDDHVHYALPLSYEEIDKIKKESLADKFCLITVPDRNRVLVTPEALAIKDRDPNNYYVFTSLDVSEYFKHGSKIGLYLKKYVKKAIKMGADGVKIIEGKPGIRKGLPIRPFDSMPWDPFFEYCEAEQIPILWHVNDPEEFWDIDKIPSWAKERGWHYDESYINNEVQYTEILNLLDKHPNLKITFAHFFFMSNQLDRLQAIFDKYPNVAIDLTPGIEMYINLSKDKEKAREFFIKNKTRILYGTDIGARAILGDIKKGLNFDECLRRVDIIHNFLNLDDKFLVKGDGNFLIGVDDFYLEGINLPDDVLEHIYSKNFINRVGNPNPIKKRLIIKECRRIKLTILIMSFIDKNIKPDYSFANSVIAYFKGKRRK